MFGVTLNKFGKRDDSNPHNDTPVTTLSKILSKTSFVENLVAEHKGHKASTSDVIPVDIDESANQEAPHKFFTTWFEVAENFSQLPPAARPVLTREISDNSSGYYTSTRSAPPTCDSERSFGSFSFRSTDRHILDCINSHATYAQEDATTVGPQLLRRTQSCNTRGWLAKRYRRQQWPRISRVLKFASGSLSPAILIDTNSCPAAITYHSPTKCVPPRRFSLSPLGEVRSSPPCGSPTNVPCIFSKFTSPEPANVLRPIESSLDCSTRPLAKKLRMDFSPTPPRKQKPSAEPASTNQNSTLPLMDLSIEHGAAHPNIDEAQITEALPKPQFEMLRHHSTPVVVSRLKAPPPLGLPAIDSPMQLSRPIIPNRTDDKPRLSRSASFPDKPTKCSGDNPEGGRRPRTLKVCNRTATGLHCVSVDTVAALLATPVDDKRGTNYIIVDCRYPYEYEGGHIKGAVNLYNHSDLVHEIFNRVPAQRPPGVPGPPKLLGESLDRRLAMPLKEPLSAPCEPLTDDDDDDEDDDDDFEDEFTSEASKLELAAAVEDDAAVLLASDPCRLRYPSEPDTSSGSVGSGSSVVPGSQHAAFVVIFHCEFSSQRAPDLAAFLRRVDRVSNYTRYPFLYFPEIYIMKGGYSAFYESYSNLCCPDSYVKMSNRDYRMQFRLYRRLAKRVSSACSVCLRPQHKRLEPPVVDPMGSFTHQSSASESRLHCANGNKKSNAFRLSRSVSQPGPLMHLGSPTVHPASNSGYDKENGRQNLVNMSMDLLGDHSSPASAPVFSESLASARSDSAPLSPSLSTLDESPLKLAESVVRVGQRVIAATMSTVGSSLGVNQFWNLFNQQLQTENIDPVAAPPCLAQKQPVPLSVADPVQPKAEPRRAVLRNLINNPFHSDELQLTPALSRKRLMDASSAGTPLSAVRATPLCNTGTPFERTHHQKSCLRADDNRRTAASNSCLSKPM